MRSSRDPRTKVSRRYDLAAIALCLIALIAALGLGYFHQVGTLGTETDFYELYAVAAEDLLAGRLVHLL